MQCSQVRLQTKGNYVRRKCICFAAASVREPNVRRERGRNVVILDRIGGVFLGIIDRNNFGANGPCAVSVQPSMFCVPAFA